MSEKNGLPRPIACTFPDDVAQVVLTGSSFAWFQSAVRARGLYLFPIPVGDEELPTFGIGANQ